MVAGSSPGGDYYGLPICVGRRSLVKSILLGYDCVTNIWIHFVACIRLKLNGNVYLKLSFNLILQIAKL